MHKNVLLKLAVFGEGGVGKTSLVNAFLGKEVPSDYSPTINSKVSKRDYILKQAGVIFKLNIWDVGGNRAINPYINKAFFTDVDLALIIFDLIKPEETLKGYKRNFLDEINRYSEEPLTLIVGNKLDKFSFSKDFQEKISNLLGEKTRFSVISVTSDINVNSCFELLIYTFLKRSEILLPDLVPENSSSEYLEIIGKNEQELRNQLVTLSTIESKYQDLKSKIKTPDKSIPIETKEEKYFSFIQQELQKVINKKRNIRENFIKNITDLEKKINKLKKDGFKSVIDFVDKLKFSLENSKKNCENATENLLRLSREENELMIISLKSKKEKEESITEVEIIPPQVIDVNIEEIVDVEIIPPQVIEVHGEETVKIETSPPNQRIKTTEPKIVTSKIKQMDVESISIPKAISQKNNEVKVGSIPKIKTISEEVKDIKLEPTLQEKTTPSKVNEGTVASSSKVEVTSKNLSEVKIAAKPIKKDPKIESYNRYERENKGRRAVFRGKETKGYLAWKEKNE
jgi:small GTP-binding protein